MPFLVREIDEFNSLLSDQFASPRVRFYASTELYESARKNRELGEVAVSDAARIARECREYMELRLRKSLDLRKKPQPLFSIEKKIEMRDRLLAALPNAEVALTKILASASEIWFDKEEDCFWFRAGSPPDWWRLGFRTDVHLD
jgi:hypothetical protein